MLDMRDLRVHAIARRSCFPRPLVNDNSEAVIPEVDDTPVDPSWREAIVHLKGAERFAGDRLAHELFDQRQLTAIVVARVRQMIESSPPTPSRALEAATAWVYLGALLDDLRAVDALLSRGYVSVALGLAAGLMDGVAMLEHYGMRQAGARAFAAHEDPRHAGSRTVPRLHDLAHRVAPRSKANPALLATMLADWYQLASAAKHKNPLILQEKIRRDGGAMHVTSGPGAGGEHTERGGAALAMGITVVLLGAIAVGNEYAHHGTPLDDLSSLAAHFVDEQGL